MHRYRIVAQISLILPILNLVLAAPIVVQEIHEARGGEVAENVAATPTEWRNSELDAASDRLTSPHSSPDAMASPQHSSSLEGSTSSGYPSPYLSSDLSVSGYSWLLDRPPRLSLNIPPSLLHGSASPHRSSSALSEIQLPEWVQELAWEMPLSPPHLSGSLHGSASPHPSGSGSEISLPGWWQDLVQEIPPSPQHTGSDRATTESYSPPDGFTPSHHPSSLSSADSLSWYSEEPMSTSYSSASDGSLTSHYFSASDGLAPSHHSMSEESPSPPPPPPTGRPLENTKFLNKNMIKRLKIVAGVIVIGGVIASIAGPQIKHRDSKDG